MNQEIVDRKKQLRREMLLLQKSLPDDYVAAASESIARQVLASREYREAGSIFLYISMPKEPDTAEILKKALQDGKKVYVPKCVSKTEMLAVRIHDTDHWKPSSFGIPEPETWSETAETGDLDLILVPCVAASQDGKRLGHGAGYYDRFLEGSHGNAICLCFRRMISEQIPTDETDVCIPNVIWDQTEFA